MEYFKGYFAAPINGEYSFMGVVDDNLYIKMSNVTNNSNPANLQLLIHGNTKSFRPKQLPIQQSGNKS